MTETDLERQLADLFQQTFKAHHAAFIETDGADPEWPLWYARYLQDQLNDLLEGICTQSELVYLLLSAEEARIDEESQLPWPDYYARFFSRRFSATEGTMQSTPGTEG